MRGRLRKRIFSSTALGRGFSDIQTNGLFESDFATISDHWHRIASDLVENADDFQQILRPSRTRISNREGKISWVLPNTKIRSRSLAEDSIT